MRIVTRRRAVTAALIVTAVASGAFLIAAPFVHGLSFVIRAADLHGFARRMADLGVISEHEREITIALQGGAIRARVYEPVHQPRRAALLVSDLHPSGIDEPRLIRLARELAEDDILIVTPDIPELSRFEITPAITDAIEQSARWIAFTSGLARDGRVGLIGFGFSGGLAIVAAGRPALREHVAYVVALGGHDDLPRVLRYLCTGQEPYPPHQIRLTAEPTLADDGLRPDEPFARPPSDYGGAVILLGLAERVVPAAQVAPLQAAVRGYLRASAPDNGVDKPHATVEFDAMRALAKRLPEPSATLLRYVVDRDVVHLGRRLLPYLRYYGSAPALSASKSPKPSAPVYLLHGIDDNVVPSIESEYLAADLRGHAPVRLLLSGLISHAEADRPAHPGDVAALASFWGDLLRR